MSDASDPGRVPGDARFLVERYSPGLTLHMATSGGEAVHRVCINLTREGRSVRYVGSIVIPAEETSLSLFESDDGRWVEEAHRRAGLPFDRVVPVIELRDPGHEQATPTEGVGGLRPRPGRRVCARRRSR